MRDDETLEQFRDRLLVEFLKSFGLTPSEVSIVLTGKSGNKNFTMKASIY